jgi:hypothetical protein
MRVVQTKFATLLVLVSAAMAQSGPSVPAAVRDVRITREGNDVRVEVTLSKPVQPEVSTALHPDRLVLDFPHTIAEARQQKITVSYDGVRTVRYGLNQAELTRLVVELDQARPYTLDYRDNLVILHIHPAASVGNHRVAPVPAASGSLMSALHRNGEQVPPPPMAQSSADIPAPPPGGPPLNFRADQTASGNSSSPAGSTRPSASHPNRASLQEGTVFPGMGMPGSGVAPGPTGTAPAGFDQTSANGGASPANSAGVQPDQPSSGLRSSQAPAAVKSAELAPAPSSAIPPDAVKEVAIPEPPVVPFTLRTRPAAFPVIPYELSVAEAPPVAAPSPAPHPAGEVNEAAAIPQALNPLDKQASGTVEPAQPVSEGQDAAQPAGEAQPATETVVASDSSSDTDLQLAALRAANPNLRTVFKVKYVAEGVAYLDGGRNDGLAEGMKLEILDSDLPPRAGQVVDPADPKVAAELQVSGIAETSAVTDIHDPKRPVKAGDLAYLSTGDAQALVAQQSLSATRKYPAVISFTEGDPLDEEARAEIPAPPLPSVNRARGRIGLDYMGTTSSGISTSNLGIVVRTDITRIGGTYWNISGYWRGRLQTLSGSSQPQTLQDLINRTYHLSLTYDNPNSKWVMGFGRMYLPWAPSLETIDGGYAGRRVSKGVTAGIFAGSTPDPTSYSYDPNQEIGGGFINFDGGSYQNFKYTSTSGVGVQATNFDIQRPFVFFENGFFYKRYFSLYDSLQVDSPKGNPAVSAPGIGLSRNFLTARIQPWERVEFDFNQTYFRDIPTFDPTLIGTGLLDKYLFQGISGGARVEVLKQIWLSAELGDSNRSGDTSSSLNQMYGITFGRVPWVKLRADARYSKFSSSFGSGTYEMISLSRNINENFLLDVLVGKQNISSTLTTPGSNFFGDANLEVTLGAHYFLMGGLGMNRGQTDYNQWHFTLGYRFDTKTKTR